MVSNSIAFEKLRCRKKTNTSMLSPPPFPDKKGDSNSSSVDGSWLWWLKPKEKEEDEICQARYVGKFIYTLILNIPPVYYL